jgi:hypothetical protein
MNQLIKLRTSKKNLRGSPISNLLIFQAHCFVQILADIAQHHRLNLSSIRVSLAPSSGGWEVQEPDAGISSASVGSLLPEL